MGSITTTTALDPEVVYHPCHLDGHCHCSSVWDSDCYCESMPYLHSNVSCDCGIILQECWNSHVTWSDFNLTDCWMPVTQVKRVTLGVNPMNALDNQLIKIWKTIVEVMDYDMIFKLIVYPSSFQQSIEVKMDKLLLCGIKHYPQKRQFYPFVYCLIQYVNNDSYADLFTLEQFARNCANGHKLDPYLIENCSNSKEGIDLFQQNTIDSKTNTPMIMINHKLYQPKNHSDYYLRPLCGILKSQDDRRMTFPWWIFTFVACIVLCILIVIWIAKSDASKSISSLFCSIFYEIEQNGQDDAAQEVLRLWHMGQLGDQEEENANNAHNNNEPSPTPSQTIRSIFRDSSSESDENFFAPSITAGTDNVYD